MALATYMLNNPDETLDADYDPEADDGGIDGWGDIIPSVTGAFNPANGDSLWGELGSLGSEIGNEFTKVPGNLADASIELVMQPVHIAQAGHNCVTDPNLGDCAHVAVTVVTVIVAKKVRKPNKPTPAVAPAPAALVDQSKFSYLFGRISPTSNAHNQARAAQNSAQMGRLGVPDTPAGHRMIGDHLDDVVADPSNVVSREVVQWQNAQTGLSGSYTQEVRQSLFAGPSGQFSLFETTWEVLGDGTRRLITVIPKGG